MREGKAAKRQKIPVYVPLIISVISIPFLFLWICCENQWGCCVISLPFEPIVQLLATVGSLLVAFYLLFWNYKVDLLNKKESKAKEDIALPLLKRDQLRKILQDYLEVRHRAALKKQDSLLKKLECDRKKIIDRFDAYYREIDELAQCSRLFILHGYGNQKPDSLIETICIKFRNRVKKGTVDWPRSLSTENDERLRFFDLPLSVDIEDSKLKLQHEVFKEALKSRVPVKSLTDYHESRSSRYRYRVVPFEVKSRQWEDHGFEFLKWMVQTYCPDITDHHPKLILFLWLNWGDHEPTSPKREVKRKQQQILSEIEQLAELNNVVFIKDRVPNVTFSDVKESLKSLIANPNEEILSCIIHTMQARNKEDLSLALQEIKYDEKQRIDMIKVEELLNEVAASLAPEEAYKNI